MQRPIFLICHELNGKKKNGWSIDKLKYLTLALDCMPNELNPYLFLHCQAAYLDELENIILSTMSEYQLFLDFEKGD